MNREDGQIKLEWYYITRALGVAVFLYGILVDDSPERGTIILTGAGMAGFDLAARSDKGGKK